MHAAITNISSFITKKLAPVLKQISKLLGVSANVSRPASKLALAKSMPVAAAPVEAPRGLEAVEKLSSKTRPAAKAMQEANLTDKSKLPAIAESA